MASLAKQPKFLEIRFRQTLSDDGMITSRATIFCPAQRRSVELFECLGCKSFVEASLDEDEAAGVLKCDLSVPTKPGTRRDGALGGSMSPVNAELARLADSTPISALIGPRVCCVREEVQAPALARFLIEAGFSSVPVVDDDGRPLGIVSHADLVRHGYAGGEFSPDAQATVGDIMTDTSVTFEESASVSQAATVMALEDIDRIPVVDRKGQVVGILSSFDMLYWLACETGYAGRIVRSFLKGS